jgi:DNA-binding XRE family transcriptional regulator
MTVREEKRRRLERRGWNVGTTRQFLRLSPEEAAYVELKVCLAMGLRDWRRRRKLTQADLAKRLQSSQSRIAKMEAGDPSVSLDLLIKSLLILGTSRRDLSRIMSALTDSRRGGLGSPA